MGNSKIQFEDLLKNKKYDSKLINNLQAGNFKILAEYSYDTRANIDFIEPILWAVKNRFNTYIVYKYYSQNLKNNFNLGKKIAKGEPQLLKDSPLMDNKRFILQTININPEIVKYVSPNLMKDESFKKELFLETGDKSLVSELSSQVKISNIIAGLIVTNDMDIDEFKETCKNSKEAIEYVAANTDKFSKEKLEIAKDIVIENGCEEAIKDFKAKSSEVKEEMSKGKENQEELLKKEKQIQRHIKTVDKWLKEGENLDKIARRIQKYCKQIETEYMTIIEEYIIIDEAITERQKIVEQEGFREETVFYGENTITANSVEIYEEIIEETTFGTNDKIKSSRPVTFDLSDVEEATEEVILCEINEEVNIIREENKGRTQDRGLGEIA